VHLLAGEIPTAERFGEGPSSWVPVLRAATTNPNLGSSGEAEGWFVRIGDIVFGGARFHFSGTGISAGSGAYIFSPPIPIDTSLVEATTTLTQATQIGAGRVRDNNTAANSAVFAVVPTSDMSMRMHTSGSPANVAHNHPGSGWVVAGSRISLYFQYPAVWE
jgi:hypothetical protein